MLGFNFAEYQCSAAVDWSRAFRIIGVTAAIVVRGFTDRERRPSLCPGAAACALVPRRHLGTSFISPWHGVSTRPVPKELECHAREGEVMDNRNTTTSAPGET